MSGPTSLPEPDIMSTAASGPLAGAWPPAFRLLGGVLVLAALADTLTTFGTLGPSQVYRKDLFQDYLAARAVWDGGDPYRPMAALRGVYFGGVAGTQAFPHPTPHPPPALLLAMPLGLLPYPVAAGCWLALEYLLLGACAVLIARRVWGTAGAGAPASVAALALISGPVRDDLVLGQFSVVILALLTGAYLALEGRRAVLGGFLLGAAVSIKFLGWPLVLFYAWKRRWGVVFGTAAALLVAHAACAPVMPGAVPKYYRTIAPHAGADYSASDGNISAWTLGQRCFGGLCSQATVNSVNAPPLFPRPGLVAPTAAAVVLATVLVSLRAAARLRDEGDGFLVMLSVSTVMNPIAWDIYLTLLLLPLAVVGRRLARRCWPPGASAALASLVILLIALKAPRALVLGDDPGPNVSALRALVTAVPLLWPLATAWAVVWSATPPRAGGRNPTMKRSADPSETSGAMRLKGEKGSGGKGGQERMAIGLA